MDLPTVIVVALLTAFFAIMFCFSSFAGTTNDMVFYGIAMLGCMLALHDITNKEG